MAKIKKEKFTTLGKLMNDTTSAGNIELMLNYDAKYHKFYFDTQELEAVFGYRKEGKHYPDFSLCDTRQKACAIISAMLYPAISETKMLEIIISNKSKKTPNKAEVSISFADLYNAQQGIGITVKRWLRIETINGFVYTDKITKDWGYSKHSDFYSSLYNHKLIEWTPEIEFFCEDLKVKIETLSNKVVDFFTVENEQEFVDKVKQSALLLNG